MEPPMHREAAVAIDLGAQSCRVSLLRWKKGIPQIEVTHRFANAPVSLYGGLHWDIERIVEEVKAGLRLCAEAAPEGIATIGVDGWAVDYVRVRADGTLSGNPFCYRDARTEEAERKAHERISPEQLYSLTGIQILRINTLYQLYADKLQGRDESEYWINLPEYLIHRLGGRRASEYTNATHSGLVGLGSRQWCPEILNGLGLDGKATPEIVPTGTFGGELTGELSKLPALRKTRLVFPACHDTASAIAAIPATGEDWAFISSGTWSLVGTVLHSPCVNEESRKLNFTNLGGVGGMICFLKNVNGMWLLRQCMDEWEPQGHTFSMRQLLEACAAGPAPDVLINVDEPELMLPGNMIAKINAQLKRNGGTAISLDAGGIPKIANTIFHSLASRYTDVISSITTLTKKKLRRLFIVGGGSRNAHLNRLTAERTGLEVIAGSTECTTIGNFAIQLAALQGEWNPSTGVSTAAVAKWAGELTHHTKVLFGDLEAN